MVVGASVIEVVGQVVVGVQRVVRDVQRVVVGVQRIVVVVVEKSPCRQAKPAVPEKLHWASS